MVTASTSLPSSQALIALLCTLSNPLKKHVMASFSSGVNSVPLKRNVAACFAPKRSACCQSFSAVWAHSRSFCRNVLKPVPQPPLEPELDLNKASGTKLFWGRPCHVDAQHGPKQEAGVQGGGTAPLVGSGAKSAMICTYYNQLYNGKCYSCTQLSTLHFVINLLEPACDMLARGWPRAGTRN